VHSLPIGAAVLSSSMPKPCHGGWAQGLLESQLQSCLATSDCGVVGAPGREEVAGPTSRNSLRGGDAQQILGRYAGALVGPEYVIPNDSGRSEVAGGEFWILQVVPAM